MKKKKPVSIHKATPIAILASEIDTCIDNADIQQLLKCIDKCQSRAEKATSLERVELYYFEANAHASIYKIKCKDGDYLNWEQPELISEILALRRSIAEPDFMKTKVLRLCQIKTNLGNCLHKIGRLAEALEQWDSALDYAPNFGMALVNRAHGLRNYGKILYDKNHTKIFLSEAYNGFKTSLQPNVWDSTYSLEAGRSFAQKMLALKEFSEPDEELNYTFDKSLGDSAAEVEYRTWCLTNKLFLNPLNDISNWPSAARDIFHLPNHVYSIDEEPRFVRFYDLLKQEFAGARALYFESINCAHPNFFDNDILLFNHFDGGLYGLKYEKLKIAFKTAYSIFDKISIFINEYFNLEKKSDSSAVSFRSVWYKKNPNYKDNFSGELENKFLNKDNWPLRALFSLTKDLFHPDFQFVALPDAKFLDAIRNAAEHRFLSIHEYLDGKVSPHGGSHCKITSSALEEKTLTILKLVRAALIYLSLAIYHEENLRRQLTSRNQKKFMIALKGIPYHDK